MQDTYNTHVKRIVIILVVALLLGFLAKKFFTPRDFGEYGHYRTGAVSEEMNLPLRHLTNESCLACHPFIKEIHLGGIHRTVSCEFCHGPYADHVRDGVKVADLPVKKGDQITFLCLRCHNKIIRARPKEYIKMVALPEHLEQKHVRLDHTCDQCHNVHAPLAYIKQARAMMGIRQEEAE